MHGITILPPPRTRFGCAYFGVRDPDLFERDLAAMAGAGFSWVLFPFTHDDAMWERATFARLVEAAEAVGLESVVSLWGGDEFGGEGVQTRLRTSEWLIRAKDTGARSFHVDEPRVSSMTLPSILDAWGDDRSAWLTIQPDRTGLIDAETRRRVAILGTDAYDGDLDERVRVTRAFEESTGRLDLAWVQAFRIADGDEAFVGRMVEAMATLAPVVGIWGWKGSTGRGELRSARPSDVQDTVNEAVGRVLEQQARRAA